MVFRPSERNKRFFWQSGGSPKGNAQQTEGYTRRNYWPGGFFSSAAFFALPPDLLPWPPEAAGWLAGGAAV
jgi:hypothetical protein